MRKLITLIIIFNFSNLFAQFANYDVGDVINDFTVTDTDGNSHNLYSILNQGKYVYIDFFATNCGTCMTKTPIFNAFYDKYGCNQGDVYCLSITVRTADDDITVENFEQQYGGNTNHAPAVSADGNAISVKNDFGIMSYPVFCMISPDGKLLYENITPIQDVNDFASTFPNGFNPPVMSCSSSLSNVIANPELKIYPNPVDDVLHIDLKQKQNITITILHLSGQLLYFKHIDNQGHTTITPNLKPGVYLINIVSDSYIYSRKLIIK